MFFLTSFATFSNERKPSWGRKTPLTGSTVGIFPKRDIFVMFSKHYPRGRCNYIWSYLEVWCEGIWKPHVARECRQYEVAHLDAVWWDGHRRSHSGSHIGTRGSHGGEPEALATYPDQQHTKDQWSTTSIIKARRQICNQKPDFFWLYVAIDCFQCT